MTAEEFSAYYKTLDHAALLNILENPEDYQALALETAQKEWVSRALPSELVARLKQESQTRQQEKQQARENNITSKAARVGNSFIDAINPIQTSTPTIDKIIRFVVIIYTLIFLYELFTELDMFTIYIGDLPDYPVESMLFFFPLILLPTALFFFWKKKEVGWYLFTIFVMFSAIVIIWPLVDALQWTSAANNLYLPQPPLFSWILHALFLGATCYALGMKKMREVYAVSEYNMVATLAFTTVFTLLALYSIS